MQCGGGINKINTMHRRADAVRPDDPLADCFPGAGLLLQLLQRMRLIKSGPVRLQLEPRRLFAETGLEQWKQTDRRTDPPDLTVDCTVLFSLDLSSYPCGAIGNCVGGDRINIFTYI